MTFAADVRKFTDNAEKAVDKTVRAVTFALFREVIQRTPVDSGRLKGNWQCTVGAAALGTLEAVDRRGSKTIVAMKDAMGGWGSVTYLSNNLPYASRIEFDGWSHTKAPEGMVRVSFARITNILRSAARAARKE